MGLAKHPRPPTVAGMGIKTLGKKFIPEDEIDDKITDETVSAYACLTSAHHIQVFQSIILVWEGACATTLYGPRL